jgi:hypothetical protein
VFVFCLVAELDSHSIVTQKGTPSREGKRGPSPGVLSCGQHDLSVLFVCDRFVYNLRNCPSGTFGVLFVCLLSVVCLMPIVFVVNF